MDDLDYTVLLDRLYSAQLQRGLKLSEALAEVGLAKSTYDNLDDEFKRKVKEDVAARVLKIRHEAEANLEHAKAEVELDLQVAEMQLRRDAITHLTRIVQRMGEVVDQGGDFNAAKAAEVITDLLRNGLQPDRRGGQIVVNATQPTAQPQLPAGKPIRQLAMPETLAPSDRIDLPSEVQTVERYPDGTTVQMRLTRPEVVDQ